MFISECMWSRTDYRYKVNNILEFLHKLSSCLVGVVTGGGGYISLQHFYCLLLGYAIIYL